MAKTYIVEATEAVRYWRDKVGRNPTRSDICAAFCAQDSVDEDIAKAILQGCVCEDPSTKELTVTQAGDDLVTGRVYPAKEVFSVKEEIR